MAERDVEKLRELLERVEKATGADRDIDFDLILTFDEESYAAREIKSFRRWTGEKQVREDGLHYWGISYWKENFSSSCPVIKITASIDAAVALVEKVLPGAEYEITNLYGVASATLPLNASDYSYETGRNECGSMPLAILAALLRTLISQAEEERA